MSRTINALYDTRAEAEVARARLASEADLDGIRILGKASVDELAKLDLSDTDRKTYADELGRGASLVTVLVKGHTDDERIIQILKESVRGGTAAARPAEAASGETAHLVAEERILVVEEELRIGKREVARGGARVHSQVREVPAEETITLKQERLDVERRAGNRFLSDAEVAAGGLLKRRVIKLTETREEPVIGKRAFVREELIVKKTVEERPETVREMVRKTEVDVEEIGRPALSQLHDGSRDRGSGPGKR